MPLEPGPWRLLGEKVEAIEKQMAAQTQSELIIVGMDKNFISSVVSFYDFVDFDGAFNTSGSHLFGGQSLMWAFWFPARAALGRNLLMIDFDRQRLGRPSLAEYFDATSDVFTEKLETNGRTVGHFYWRVGYRYHMLKS